MQIHSLVSESKLKVIDLLLSIDSLSLREIHYLSQVPLRSVQLIIKGLLRDKLVSEKERANRKLYSLIKYNNEPFFDGLRSFRENPPKPKYKNATRIPEFIDEIRSIVKTAKLSRNGT